MHSQIGRWAFVPKWSHPSSESAGGYVLFSCLKNSSRSLSLVLTLTGLFIVITTNACIYSFKSQNS